MDIEQLLQYGLGTAGSVYFAITIVKDFKASQAKTLETISVVIENQKTILHKLNSIKECLEKK